MPKRLFKVLDTDGRPCHGGVGRWSLPTADGPGAWMPPITDLKPRTSGYHLCRPGDLLAWLGPAIYEAEWRGNRLDTADKVVVSEARLLSRCDSWPDSVARQFATDCAARVLPLFEAVRPHDDRPRHAILVARDPAARAAAWAAGGEAAWEAAWAAARAAAAAVAAVADDAARATERQWQTQRLLTYLDGPAPEPWPLP